MHVNITKLCPVVLFNDYFYSFQVAVSI